MLIVNFTNDVLVQRTRMRNYKKKKITLLYLGGGGVGCSWTILFCDTLYDRSPFPQGINTLTLYLWNSKGGSGGAGGIFGTSTSTETEIFSILIFSSDCDNNAKKYTHTHTHTFIVTQ